MNICVFCSSTENLAPEYYETGFKLGKLMAQQGHTLVFGGYTKGIMGAVGRGVQENGGNITPHVCRHTYCSNMAKSGMNPKTLQYLMGHSDISVTLNTYTHLGLEDAAEELERFSEARANLPDVTEMDINFREVNMA